MIIDKITDMNTENVHIEGLKDPQNHQTPTTHKEFLFFKKDQKQRDFIVHIIPDFGETMPCPQGLLSCILTTSG